MDRKKIFGIFGGFLAVMLGFTILSRGVSGASMARVETVKISTGTIDHTVTGSGRVEAGKEVAVYTESGQRVKEIFVREGQTVEEGELLFTIDMEELEEQILEARQEMEKIRLQNQDAQSASSVERKNRELRQNRAQEDYSQAVSQGDAQVAAAKAALDEAQQALEEFLSHPVPEAEKDGNDNGAQEAYHPNGAEGDGQEAEDQVQPKKDEESQEPESAPDASAQETEKARLEQAVSEAQAAYEAALSSRAENVKNAARELEDASQQKAADSTSKQNEITRQQQELALNKLLALQEAEGKITAPVRGMITNISIVTGDFTTEGTTMRLADTSKGGRLTVTVDKFYEEFGQRYRTDGSYAVYFFHGSYDVPLKAGDKESLWESEEVYRFLVCAVCPVSGDYEPGAPECGFLFPAFKDRGSDILRADIFTAEGKSRQAGLLKGILFSGR